MKCDLKYFLLIIFSISNLELAAQKVYFKDKKGNVLNKKEAVFRAYTKSVQCIEKSKIYFDSVIGENSSKDQLSQWKSDPLLTKWFGSNCNRSDIKKVRRRIAKLSKKVKRNTYFIVPKKSNKGLCKGSRHAWTIPFGKVRIHLCDQFFYKSNRHWTKIFIHELAHETGILFHQKVYWKGAALRAAAENPDRAIRNPENYAYFIMEFYR